MTKQKKLYDYELIVHSGIPLPRQYKIYRLTESEAHERNQGFAINGIYKRFIRVKARFN